MASLSRTGNLGQSYAPTEVLSRNNAMRGNPKDPHRWGHLFVACAIATMPLQYAFTLPRTFPIRLIPEIFGMLAILCYIFSHLVVKQPPRSAGKALRPRTSKNDVSYLLAIALGAVVVVSGIVNYVKVAPPEIFRQYELNPQFDILWFTIRALLCLILWIRGRHAPPSLLTAAFHIATWVMIAGVLFQWAMFVLGQFTFLGSLGFRNEASGIMLDSSSVSLPRSGTFPNGQELAFFAGICLFVSIKNKWWIAMSGSVVCIFYSFGTTAFVGIAAGLLAVVVFSVKVAERVAIVVVAILAALVVSSSAYLTDLVQFQLAKLGLGTSSIFWAGQSLEIRSIKTSIALQLAGENPWFGVGAARFGNSAALVADSSFVPPQVLVTVENSWAQVAAEHGVFAVALLALIFVYYFAVFVKERSVWLMALVVYLSVGVSTQSSWTQFTIWLTFAYLTTQIQTGEHQSSTELTRAGRYRAAPGLISSV